eukprot:15112943-Heterocapsa_arctica.AAC.1
MDAGSRVQKDTLLLHVSLAIGRLWPLACDFTHNAGSPSAPFATRLPSARDRQEEEAATSHKRRK